MAKTETKAAVAAELELPPEGGNVSVISTLEEDAHYLRVTLDKSENFKVAAGKRLLDLLINKFAHNRNALRDWYEENVAQGKAHRAWSTVSQYLSVVRNYGEEAEVIFEERHKKKLAKDRVYDIARGRVKNVGPDENETKLPSGETPRRPVKSEYDLRKAWLSDMNVLWFKGENEWQDRWLQDRDLLRGLSRSHRG